MTTAQQTINHARGFIGTTESPAGSNCNPFSHYLNRGCHYWCADYTVAVLQQMGVPIPPGADTASTRLNLAAWKKAGKWVERNDIRLGDVLFFHISGRNGTDRSIPDHTGFCTSAPNGPGRILSVEGNTSSNDYGSQDNGGGVFERTRALNLVIGAGRPDYSEPPPPLPQPPQEDDEMLVVFADKTKADPSQVLALDGRLYVIDQGDTAAAIAGAGFKTLEVGAVDYAQLKQKAEQ